MWGGSDRWKHLCVCEQNTDLLNFVLMATPFSSLSAAPVHPPPPPPHRPTLQTTLGMGHRPATVHLSTQWCGWRRARVRKAQARS